LHDLRTGAEREVPLDPGETYSAGHVLWSPDGTAVVLTLAIQPCSGDWAESVSVIKVDAATLEPVTLVERDDRLFVSAEWPTPEQVLLLDRNGGRWWMDPATGQVTQAGAASVPSAAPTAILGEPIVLPALASWQADGYGGGGTGNPVPPRRTYVLGTALPDGPAQMPVYVQREPDTLTAAYAAQIAERLDVDGPVYQSLRLVTSAHPEDEMFRGYVVVDGAREVLFEASGIVRYTDRSRTSILEGHWNMPQGVPPLAQAVGAAEELLRSAGLLEDEYQVAATGDTLLFYRVLGGQWPVVEPFARITVWQDGQVGQAQLWPLALEVLAEYPIRSAQEAWQILSSGQPDARSWPYPYRSPEMPPWGEWSEGVVKSNPRVWVRTYRAGQEVHRFGMPEAWFPTDAGDTPFLSMGNLVLTGDVQSLAGYILQQYVRERRSYVHTWGEIQDASEVQALCVEGWEPAEEVHWSGTIQRQGDRGTLTTGDSQEIQVLDLPDALPDGADVYVSGGQHNDVLEWSLIQESLVGPDPPPVGLRSEMRMIVEQVDLVYLALAPNVIPPDRYADLGFRAVQPVWRFRGRSEPGAAFEIYVQAVSEAYVDRQP
jgi:hypothetical protein